MQKKKTYGGARKKLPYLSVVLNHFAFSCIEK